MSYYFFAIFIQTNYVMPSIKFFISGKSENSTIYVRFVHGRKYDFKRATHLSTNHNHWNPDREEVRKIATATNRDEINQYLIGLKGHLINKFTTDYAKGVTISSFWLASQIRAFSNQREDTDLNNLDNYCQYFISNLSTKKNKSKGEVTIGVSDSTIKKYKNIVRKLEGFQSYTKKKLELTDIDHRFETDFIKYLREVETLNPNTIGRSIKFVKTILRDAQDNGFKVSPQLTKIQGWTSETKFVTLHEEEIDIIYEYDFSNTPYLDNARDWLIIGLFTGQRVSDFMSFNSEVVKEGFLEFKQRKTGKKVIVPLHEYVRTIMQKYGGSFPKKISDARFNEYIKLVCQRVGLTNMVEGSLNNPKTKRKEEGFYPKYKLVSSHICRRSFATNHYGKLPTTLLMSVTGHSTEKMFLKYIGKTPMDNANQLKEYWEALEIRKKDNKQQ